MVVKPEFFTGGKDKKPIMWEQSKFNKIVTVVSGGFDPIHIGHLKYILAAKKVMSGYGGAVLVAIVNGDGFLQRKKNYVFMPQEERAEIVDHIKGVDFVMVWDDGSQFVHGALEIIKPNIFAKGGDRHQDNMPDEELNMCEKIGTMVSYGVGGTGKLNSSSELVNNMKRLKNSE